MYRPTSSTVLPVSEPVKKYHLLFHVGLDFIGLDFIGLDFIGHAPLPVEKPLLEQNQIGEPHAGDGADA
jgi:hypothetical protein